MFHIGSGSPVYQPALNGSSRIRSTELRWEVNVSLRFDHESTMAVIGELAAQPGSLGPVHAVDMF
jgi:hypothetical protein